MRTPYDGRLFYCDLCGLEYLACELPDCELESVVDAQVRKQLADLVGETVARDLRGFAMELAKMVLECQARGCPASALVEILNAQRELLEHGDEE